MHLNYAISLANFFHYANIPKVEEIIAAARDMGYGVELWRELWGEKKDLFSESERRRLRGKLKGMEVSVHSNRADTLDTHKFQIEAARDLGARMIVVHRDELCLADRQTLDPELASKVVDFATTCGVMVAVENLLSANELSFLVEVTTKIPQIGICLDISHVYFTPTPLKDYLDALAPKIIHVHLQDTRPEGESSIPWSDRNNCIPGTGGIPGSDWRMFAAKLLEIGYSGMAVFETKPRNPLQEAFLGRSFVMGLFRKS